MSKRKGSTQAFRLDEEDMTFEFDGVQDDLQTDKTETESVKSDSRSRFSGRAKKVKAIYDPSEHNGPVHKRKKEAMEAAEKSKVVVSKTPTKLKPVNSPAKRAPPAEPLSNSAPKAKVVAPRKTLADVTKRLSLDEGPKPAPRPRKMSVMPTVPVVKEPSKRIQQRKVMKVDEIEGITGIVKKKQRSRSVSIAPGPPSVISSAFDEASTVSLNDGIPDVRHWTHHQVCDYFSSTLKFSKQDAAVFKNEEIDGETLLIMKRSDIIRFQHLKVNFCHFSLDCRYKNPFIAARNSSENVEPHFEVPNGLQRSHSSLEVAKTKRDPAVFRYHESTSSDFS